MGYSIRDRLTKDFYVPLFAGLDGAERALPFNIYGPYTNVGGTAQGPGQIGQGDGGYGTPNDTHIDTPEITSPVCGSEDEVELDAEVTASTFSSDNGQTHAASRWFIELLDADGELLDEGTGITVYDSGVVGPGPLDLSEVTLQEGYSYRVKVRYKGSGGGWSDYSDSCSFVTVGCGGELVIWFDMSDHDTFVPDWGGAGDTGWTHISNKGSADIQLKRSGGTGDASPSVSQNGSPGPGNPWPTNSIEFTEGALLVTTSDTDTAMNYEIDKGTMFFVGLGDLSTGDYRAFTWHDKDRYVDIGSNEFGFHSTPASTRGFVNFYSGHSGWQAVLEGPNLGTGQHVGVIAVQFDMTDDTGPDPQQFVGALWFNGTKICDSVDDAGSCADDTFNHVNNPTFNIGMLDAGGVSTHGGGAHQFAEYRVYAGRMQDSQVQAVSNSLKSKWGIA